VSKLSPKDRLARLQKGHNKAVASAKKDWKEVDGLMSIQITEVERELGFPIMGDYPLMKFLQQRTDLEIIHQREKEANR